MQGYLFSIAIIHSIYASYSTMVNALPQVPAPNLPFTPSSNPPPYPEIKPNFIALAVFETGKIPYGKMSALDPTGKEPPFCEGMFQTFEIPFTSLIKCRDGYELQYSLQGDFAKNTPTITYQFTHFVPGKSEMRTVETGVLKSQCGISFPSGNRDCTWPFCSDGSSNCKSPVQKKSRSSSLEQ